MNVNRKNRLLSLLKFQFILTVTDFIKYDVEGAEHAALCGTRETLKRTRPTLKIACYHRSEDLFDLPLLLRELAPDHQLHLQRQRSLPAWDLDIIAIPK